ncbi:uncharacterized protein PITG_20124 [Phytophthora infestans T30-4]|uniref:Uncharacterized protein n=1 Tax=Phytophthora infestans (strain T30-4) TaxID=403677 RepID=D0P1N6_PHYIT|nr:uncharacterized protein PITG_20124 [Phytophthora infestans T30-4]EEY54668.1 hypothetical protein PITG_20124 [Phytophthora infestans T30-4]|eukprot:XP_002895785.1 hypothetical protein PITG_20124 [Phytophthora infestans T30-4]
MVPDIPTVSKKGLDKSHRRAHDDPQSSCALCPDLERNELHREQPGRSTGGRGLCDCRLAGRVSFDSPSVPILPHEEDGADEKTVQTTKAQEGSEASFALGGEPQYDNNIINYQSRGGSMADDMTPKMRNPRQYA